MNRDVWQKVKEIFDAALKLAPDKRGKFLDESCGNDKTLRLEVENLLDSFGDDSFLEHPAAEEVASVIIKAEAKNLEAGKCFGHYEIVRQIGAGGMGEVYLAKDKKLDRRVAIKILNEKFARHESNLGRFTQEAKAVSALNHPNILVIHEIGESQDTNYIVSEFIEGKTLREIVGEAPIKLLEILDIAIQIVNALAAAHAAHIVHRDIKPENVMIRPDGYVKILDFGLAKLVEQKAIGFEESTVQQNATAKGLILGTINYMSPEQAKGEPIDERTDIFSFGVVLYEMIAGRTPFAGDSMSETFANLINQEPQPLSRFSANVPEELQRIVSKMLRKNKDERYQTMKGLLPDLKSLQKRLEFEAELGRSSPPDKQLEAKTQTFKADTRETTQKTAQTNSIAVLPFANMSNDAENEYFCDGLAEELLNALSKIKDLKVAARTSAFSFKNRNVDVSEIGNALNVKTILEGSVRKAGNRLRISVQLVNASNGYHIWSERYDGELKDIFDLQDEITLAVIDELQVKFLSEEKAALRNRYAENVEAYQLYLKGRHHFLKLTPEEIEKGISYFQQAIEMDSSYALAYAGLTAAYVTFSMTCDSPSAEFFPKAKEVAHQAIKIDDRLSETYAALFWATFWYDWDWNAAEEQCLRAIELNLNGADAHEAYAHLLSNIGRHAEALSEIKRARELDPLHLRINALEGQFLLHAGKIDEALDRLQKTLELQPFFWLAHLFISSVYIEKQMFAEAAEAAQKARQFSGISTHPIAFRGYALAKSGKESEARASLEELLKLSATRYVPPPNIAMIYNGLGESVEALAWLERGFHQRDARMAFLKVEPKWNNLRSDSRFQDLLRRVGFPTDETTRGKTITEPIEAKTTDAPADNSVKTAAELTTQSQTRKSFGAGNFKNQKYVFIGVLIIFLLAVAGFGYYLLSAKKSVSGASGKKSLAVLPFVNASQDANAEYLSDGITESVINNLSQLSGLRVMSRNSAFRFKNNQTDAQAIASQLGVENLVTGDIKQIGDKLVINVRLIDGSDDSQIWGNQYVKTTGDIIAAQTEIAQAVAQNLRVKLTNSEQQRLSKKYTENSEAFQLYLKGNYHAARLTPPEIHTAISYFEQAIDIDPTFALAYVGMANAYRALPLTSDVPAKEAFPKAKAAAAKALEIDEGIAEAHADLGYIIFWHDWNWDEAEKQYRRALELDPNNVTANYSYAHLKSNLGRHEEAVALVKRARELDPLSLIINSLEAQFLFFAGRNDEAFSRAQKTLELEPNFWHVHLTLSRIYIAKGMYREAVAEAIKARDISGGNAESIATIGYALALWGKRDEAKAVIDELKKQSAERYVPPYDFALIHAALGESDEAFRWLERGFEERGVRMTFLKVDPKWDKLRSDARFVSLVKRMNLE